MAVKSPFGQKTRARGIAQYMAKAGPITIENAWEHVYRLLLSIDRRTRLAHVMDSNHMQPGGSWHERAARFTSLLCEAWGVEQRKLNDEVDYLFQFCVKEYLKLRQTAEVKDALEEVESEFMSEISEMIGTRIGGLERAVVSALVRDIDRSAEHYFTIERKRQNVRGEGFEDIQHGLLLNLLKIPEEQVLLRVRADKLPGFQPKLASAKKSRLKVPKPDLGLISADRKLTRWIVTSKWSLRQDRLDQFGQEAAYYKEKKVQAPGVDFVLVTNEMDIARLRDVLSPPPGAGGFHFHRVYHINCDLLARTHDSKFKELELYAGDRLFSFSDFLRDVQSQFGPPKTVKKRAQRG